jgi:hypothetical protein
MVDSLLMRVLYVALPAAAAAQPLLSRLQTIMANGGFGMTVLTALTAQNSTGVQGIFVVPPAFLQQQLSSIFSDLPPAAVKTGMLPDAAAVEAVADMLRQCGAGAAASSSATVNGSVNGACRNNSLTGSLTAPGQTRPQELPVVVDPVMVSTSGHSLAKESVCAALKQHLIPLATMITPNLAEAQALLGEQLCIRHAFVCLSASLSSLLLAFEMQQLLGELQQLSLLACCDMLVFHAAMV